VKHVLTLVCCMVLCSLLGLAQKKTSEKAAMSDQEFVNFAGQIDMVDANLGKLASTAASSKPTKEFAQKLVSEQTDDFQSLSKVARQANLSVPEAIDKEHNRTMIDPFQKLKGAAFDHRFAKEMIAADTKSIDIYKKEAANAQTPALRTYAEESLPVLQSHLSDAKSLESTQTSVKKG
jgi:putative membrane protein